jgi:hypothetical protein
MKQPKPAQVAWYGDRVLEAALQGALAAAQKIGLKIEDEAKDQLYPGHGKLHGVLQRSIVADPPRVTGRRRVQFRVGPRGLKYAGKIERRYSYMRIGADRVRPQAPAILAKHLLDALGDSL